MSASSRYLIDSNVLIEAHRRYYGFDLCPGFWESIVWLHGQNRVHSLVLVTHEEHRPDVKKRIPIPNVCKAFDVPHVNTFEMLKALAIRYHWTSPS